MDKEYTLFRFKKKYFKSMSLGMSLMKQALLGNPNIHASSPVDCLYVLEKLKDKIQIKDFNPLIPLTGGASLTSNKSAQVAIAIGNSWINKCIQYNNVDSRQACIALAANYDTDQSMVALALEMAMYCTKDRCAPSLKMEADDWLDVFQEVFMGNYADIVNKQSWIELSEEGVKEIQTRAKNPAKTRTFWAHELGHDVLIHPMTQHPCHCEQCGERAYLKYFGIVEKNKKLFFKFKCLDCGRGYQTNGFVPYVLKEE